MDNEKQLHHRKALVGTGIDAGLRIRAILLPLLVSLAACGGGYTLENPDDFCKELLANNNPQELKTWLYDGKSTLGEMQTNEKSVSLANKAYEAGAINIYGIDLEVDPELGSNTGMLVVELPDEKEERQLVLDWAAPIAHKQGFDAYSDVGQRYVFVMLD